jgi:hypothetical protein
MQEIEGSFRAQVFTAFDPANIDFADVRADLNHEVERFTNVSSGWISSTFLRFTICIGQYRLIVGSSFIPTPTSLMHERALINVYIPDNYMCFA